MASTDQVMKGSESIVQNDAKEMNASTANTEQKSTNETDYDLHVKPEYVLKERHPCLQPLMERKEEEYHPNQKQKKNRHKQNVRNAAKSGKEKTLSDMKVCKQTMVGEECPFGEKCKFKDTHDMKLMLQIREPDIKNVQCPSFDIYGKCQYGIACRVGAQHIDFETGKNITKNVEDVEETTKNNVPYKKLVLLRKDKYPFVCKRYRPGSDKKRKNKDRNDSEQNINETANKVKVEEKSTDSKPEVVPVPVVANSEAVDMTPLPQMKKLIDFSNKVYVAPLTTVGNLPFRRIMKKYGADITCGEMAVATNLLQGRTGEWALLKRHKDEDIFGVQIAAGHADNYERLSEVIKNEGVEIDFLDMNLGCPIDVICEKGAGAKLMMRESTIRDAVQGMGKNLDCPITIKIRTGWDENKPFAHKLVPKIQSWGFGNIGAIMLHGRSRLQRYSRLANWEYIEQVANAQSSEMDKIPIIGNGDIFSYTDYEEKVLEHKGLSNTAMLGRGALIKPWLPTEIKERRHWDISATERLDMLKDFVYFGLEHWGSDEYGVANTRRFLLEWLSFLHRYVPVGLLEAQSIPQKINLRPPQNLCGRSDLETMMMSDNCADWIKISEMLLGPVREGFDFQPKHRAKSYSTN